MNTSLSREQLLERLIQSLRVVEVNTQLYDAGEIVAWMPVATELYKLLIKDRYGALVPELFPALKLHPIYPQRSSSDIRYTLRSPGFSVEDRSLKFDLFDLGAQTISIPDWLQQGIVESEEVKASIADFVLLMRNHISAHTIRNMKGKPRIIEQFGVITEAGITRPAFTRILIDIAIYLVAQLNAVVGREPGSRLLLIDQRRLVRIAQQHNEAKDLMDKVVHEGADITEESIGTATSELENSAKLLLPEELRLWAVLIYTHLGEAHGLSYMTSKDRRHLFQAISALENAKVLFFDEASPRQRALLLFNLGQIYNAASASLGRSMCWRISFSYFQELINTVLPEEEPDLYTDAVYEAAWLALKLLRISAAYKYFRLHRTRTKATPA